MASAAIVVICTIVWSHGVKLPEPAEISYTLPFGITAEELQGGRIVTHVYTNDGYLITYALEIDGSSCQVEKKP